MGNASTTNSTANIVIGIKRSQENQNNKLYHLVDYQGEGELVQWMKYSLSIGDFNILDGIIELKVTPFLFAGGKGKLVPISELVKLRNDERNAMLSTLRRKKGKGKSGPNILESINQENMQGDMMKALQMLDGGGKEGAGAKYRELCWSMSQRGVMGETLVHICLLNGTYLNNEVAKHLIKTFPKLVNDIYLSEEYYGQSALHQAIINEDLAMVRFLLRNGADVHQRCYGAFFCPDDQKETRCDSLEHEWVDVDKETNYAGRTYWGEYPLSFAACTRQPECFRLLIANKADPNMRDTNGNTVLHLMVIHELPEMFDLAYRLGAKLHIQNNQNLIPLTLAAKLAKKKMFDHVLNYEKQYLWTYGSLMCIAYPLSSIDTIEEETGKLKEISALSLITFAESSCHLMLFEGLVENLLEAKWKTFAKRKSVKHLGPFIHMFYKMIAGDVFRFLLIYMIFLFGFSQAFFIIFLGCHREMNTANYSTDRLPLPENLAEPLESMARVFLMSVGEFSAIYKVLDTCRLAVLGKVRV
ncbi:unnamed protein product [Soboliphyme baturini]|uniref:ANK_REP_REGION domain-containing protein n=1 Tax=Soboliphyme baturini TaxID=241478 RepID=A0A183IXA3_9BILA|nr:unnamed protein product [Soboliphyme baturini]